MPPPVSASELVLAVTARLRSEPRLDQVGASPELEDPPLEALCALARGLAPGDALWLGGGEPTLRPDLPGLVAALADHGPGLCTDGLALGSAAAVQTLREAGLERVRLTLHAATPAAHDWLCGVPGAGRAVVRAIRECVHAGLGVELACTVVRPNTPHLLELLELAERVGVSAVRFRRGVGRGAIAQEPIMLMARLAEVEPQLEAVAARGRQRKLGVVFQGFVPCAAGRARSLCRDVLDAPPTVVAGAAWSDWRARHVVAASRVRCGKCPGAPACEGAPADYVERFGPLELLSERVPVAAEASPHTPATPARAADVSRPPPRAGRAPATRARVVIEQLRGTSLAGDPVPAGGERPPASITVTWRAPARVACAACAEPAGELEPSRRVRLRLVRAAQQGATTLRVVGASILTHPQARELLKECTMLSFDRVEVACEGSPLDELSDANMTPLRRLDRFDVALYGPDGAKHDAHMGRPGAFDATLQGLARFADATGVEVGAFAVLHDASEVAAFAEAWNAGRLPGAPAFRLSEQGARLAQLAEVCRALPAGPARSALEAALPPCLCPGRAVVSAPAAGPGFIDDLIEDGLAVGSDRFGRFTPCHCGPRMNEGCPGLVPGWDHPGPADR